MSARQIVQEWYRDRPTLVFGHRGASAYAPMNTLPAFRLALEQGADGVELDVHLTLDGELVIVHDFSVDETTDGEGQVSEMTLEQVKSLDAGAWFDERYRGTRVPTLGEVFDAIGTDCIINVEIKSQSLDGDGTEAAVVKCIEQHGMQERSLVSSFNPHVVERFRTIAPDIPLAFLTAPGLAATLKHNLVPGKGYDVIHPYFEMIDDQQMAFVREHDLFINTWTVNNPAVAQSLSSLGVHGIMTDKPDLILQALR